MRFMVLVLADERTEAGEPPGVDLVAALARYNEELVRAGVLLAGDGLTPSAGGVRVRFADGRVTVVEGPFGGPLVAGYWLIEVDSREEAIEWVRRCPFEGSGEIEIRRVAEPADFGDPMSPELREHEEYLRAQLAQRRRR